MKRKASKKQEIKKLGKKLKTAEFIFTDPKYTQKAEQKEKEINNIPDEYLIKSFTI